MERTKTFLARPPPSLRHDIFGNQEESNGKQNYGKYQYIQAKQI